MKLALLVIGYNRLNGFKRTIESLEKANYYGDNIDLILSIDNSGDTLVSDYANNYIWNFGKKIVRTFPERQGLKKHILSCGKFLEEYDAIAVFEDDVVASQSFYSYMKETVSFYINDENIGGISLYGYAYNVNARIPFVPEKSDYDVYFMQYAQSWGQIWLKNTFLPFLKWIENENIVFGIDTPNFVNSWSDKSSWLKFHIKYCVEKNLFFVYPYNSLTTCYSDVGEHVKGSKVTMQQVPIVKSKDLSSFKLVKLTESNVKYDVFFERIVDDNDLLIDLYGTKVNLTESKKYLLTTRRLNYRIINSYSLDAKPHEVNYFENILGGDIFLYDTTVVVKNKFKSNDSLKKYEYYFYFLNNFKNFSKLFFAKLKNKLFH